MKVADNMRTTVYTVKEDALLRALLLRFDHKDSNFLGAHYLAFAMINLRPLFASYV